ncbi:sensor histidine kinase [Brasilonema octagenarum]|uniref:Histidine kinase n=1 Tax=Brasilonema octagenarum UFV-OR1 TaxID=417115 RepID=A0ABX1MH17_9CYAN|nr:CHASE2 domain-containing protein [Brasilonema octagenarum]NMF65172.1 histidine kinase [Brasilonema octagenarum UFV-OR1]
MYPSMWKKVKEEIFVWRLGASTGILIIGLVIIARLTGSLQALEWLAFDTFLRLRPSEPIDERILIVGINEDDIRSIKKYSVPDRDLAALLVKLQTYKPRVIGLDLYRNLPVPPDNPEMIAAFKGMRNLIAIEKVLPDKVEPTPYLSSEQIGFADQMTDTDGKLRRSLLGTPTPKGYKFSLSLRLAETYLTHEGISLENGLRDRDTMRFANTELPRFLPNSGGYVKADAGGVQVLLNFKNGRERFRTVSLNDIKTGNFKPEWIRDRIVIIGMTASSVKDLISTSTIASTKTPPGRVYGVEIQAHQTSQIISAVLDGRPLINAWTKEWEYIWVIGWGLVGIYFARLTKYPLINLLAVSIASINLIGSSYLLLLIWGCWVPVIPAILVLTLNGVGLTALFQYDQTFQAKMNVRQIRIERTFETIHNGPLQTLAKALRRVKDGKDLPPDELLCELEKDLEKLNYELRGIYEFLQREPQNQENRLYIGSGIELNLQNPLHDILYQVYNYTLERDFPCFKTLKFKVRTFEPIEDRHLSIEQKQGVCRFLEEALCNVGKHALGLTRLEVIYENDNGWYTLRIKDNGLSIKSYEEGQGTRQFKYIAQQLKGKFTRSPVFPKGTLCELSWLASKKRWLLL